MTVSPLRLIRWIAVITVFIVATLACWQDPGYTREAVRVTVCDDSPGAATAPAADDGTVGLVLVTGVGAAALVALAGLLLLLRRRGRPEPADQPGVDAR